MNSERATLVKHFIKLDMSSENHQNVKQAARAAGTGALVGAGLSTTLGGMGLAVGGTAFSIGMAPVATAGAIVGLATFGILKALDDDFEDEGGGNYEDRWNDDLEDEDKFFEDEWDDDFEDEWDDDFEDEWDD